MTKEEALKLENRCDKIMSGYLGEECTVSLALSGKMRIGFDGGFITLNKNYNAADYINYHGFYVDLIEKITQAITCVEDNRDIYDQLIWSYEHRTELEGWLADD